MWKAEFIEIRGELQVTEEFSKQYQLAYIEGLKEAGELTPMQYLEAVRLLEGAE